MQFKSWVESERGRAMAVSRAIDVPPSFVSKMVSGEKAIPAEHCKAIQQLSGGLVTCQEMRPNDWHKYWPELGQSPANTAHTEGQVALFRKGVEKSAAHDGVDPMRAMLTSQRDRAVERVAANPNDRLSALILKNRNDALVELAPAPANTAQPATKIVAQGVANV